MKLLLADDHTLFRDALVQYIQRAHPDAQVVTARDFDEALIRLESNCDQDLVMLDLRMPGMNGMKGFEKMHELYPDIRVALMSGVAEPKDVEQALKLGAVGYFPKTLSGKALLQAIQQVLDGQIFVPVDHKTQKTMPSYYGEQIAGGDKQAQRAEGESEADDDERDDFNLTPREKDVLEYLITGASNKEIAAALELQVVTVKLHVRGIFRKLDVKNRTQAALVARKHGLAGKQAAGV